MQDMPEVQRVSRIQELSGAPAEALKDSMQLVQCTASQEHSATEDGQEWPLPAVDDRAKVPDSLQAHCHSRLQRPVRDETNNFKEGQCQSQQ